MGRFLVPGKAGACPLPPDPLAPEVVLVELGATTCKSCFIITMITSNSTIDIFYRDVYCYVLLMSTNSKAAIYIATGISITSDCPLSSSKLMGV